MYYEDENNLYHYSYRKGDKAERVRDADYAETPSEPLKADPWEEKKPKKNRLGMKLAALALVCALIATYIFGLGTMAGTCAIAVFTFAYVGNQLCEIIETVDMGPYEAMEALGATRLQAFTTAVFPQVLPTYLSVSLFCLEGNVRYASILGYVGAGGLGLIMNEKIGWREYDSLGMILIVLFVTVIVIEALSHWLRKRLT